MRVVACNRDAVQRRCPLEDDEKDAGGRGHEAPRSRTRRGSAALTFTDEQVTEFAQVFLDRAGDAQRTAHVFPLGDVLRVN